MVSTRCKALGPLTTISASVAGGNGGNGLCVIIEYYGG